MKITICTDQGTVVEVLEDGIEFLSTSIIQDTGIARSALMGEIVAALRRGARHEEKEKGENGEADA